LLEHLEGDKFREGFVLPTNPPSNDPFGPLILQVNSVGEPELGTNYQFLPLVPCEDFISMETQQIHLSDGYITPPRVLGPFEPMQTCEKPQDILTRVDTIIESSFKLL
jgi:hypothetical protein